MRLGETRRQAVVVSDGTSRQAEQAIAGPPTAPSRPLPDNLK